MVKKAKTDKMLLILSYVLVFVLGLFVASLVFQPSAPAAVEELKPLDAGVFNASAKIFAVRSDTGEGVLNYVDVEVRPGKGRRLINTNPFVEPDTQFSGETAAKVAQNITGVDLSDRDVLYSFQSDSQLVGGPSAGAAMAVATIAAIQNKTVRSDVGITGTVDENGRVGVVGGVIEKAAAAAKSGVKLFLVPKGLEVLNYYEQHITTEQQGPFIIQRVNYVPKQLDLNNYTSTQWGMNVSGVATVEEAAELLIE